MQHLADEHGISLNFQSGPQLPPIIANFQLLEQAFVNLITNSCEAMPDGGRIDVSTHHSNGHVVLDIADSGPGIPEDLVDKVFDLYVTTKESGSGVGLSLVYRIVQLHGGDVRIESEPGKGTRATITLKESTL
jgi:signal transduction histidine kinase